ncbi:MAG: hypothetical protein WDA13_03395 [Candidatus Shapirobacteria bacterium]
MNNIKDIFNQIRDIPYSIPVSIKEKDYCCSGKHKILKQFLDNLGYKTRYQVVSFEWSSMNLPQKLLNVPHENLISHVYLEIFLNDKWVDMDATWDPKLKSVLPINEWNGSENIIAVPIIEKFSLKKSQEIMENENEEETIKDLKINGKFYQAFNRWLEEIRKRK